jgi:hypothetical protein
MSDAAFELTVQFNEQQARHLVKFAKQAGWKEYRACATDDDEAFGMFDAMDRLWLALYDAGFDRR